MIRYLNGLDFFNLGDLMYKYNISRSTALRDISSLEQLGMPIFSEYGRHGRYGILKDRLLSPIIFTLDEVYALYFAMLTLEDYQSTPFAWRDSSLLELVRTQPKRIVKFYLDTGTIRDTQLESRKMKRALEENGYAVTYGEYPEGHNWVNWRARLSNILTFFWGKQ